MNEEGWQEIARMFRDQRNEMRGWLVNLVNNWNQGEDEELQVILEDLEQYLLQPGHDL